MARLEHTLFEIDARGVHADLRNAMREAVMPSRTEMQLDWREHARSAESELQVPPAAFNDVIPELVRGELVYIDFDGRSAQLTMERACFLWVPAARKRARVAGDGPNVLDLGDTSSPELDVFINFEWVDGERLDVR